MEEKISIYGTIVDEKYRTIIYMKHWDVSWVGVSLGISLLNVDVVFLNRKDKKNRKVDPYPVLPGDPIPTPGRRWSNLNVCPKKS